MTEFILRKLNINDYNKGIWDLYSHLATFSEPPPLNQFALFLKQSQHANTIVVIEDSHTQKIVSTGKLIIEQKLYGAKMGHIEDIITLSQYRKKGLGSKIIQELTKIAWEQNCYKIVLNTNNINIPFYLKNGFKVKGIEMCKYQVEF
jgi:glucosamine-phosphate N-acetyltransferase